MNKMIFRLGLLIVGLLMGTTCSFSQIPSMKSIPDSILAHYSSLESRGYVVVELDTADTGSSWRPWRKAYYLGAKRLAPLSTEIKVDNPEQWEKTGDFYTPKGTYYVLLKDTPEKRFAMGLIDFMKYKDSLRLEERINAFLLAAKQEKTFKKFFKVVKERYGKRYTTDNVVKLVTEEKGHVVFPECDAENVKSFMKAYNVEPRDFLIYFKIQKTEDYYLDNLLANPYAPGHRAFDGWRGNSPIWRYSLPEIKEVGGYSQHSKRLRDYTNKEYTVYNCEVTIDGETYTSNYYTEMLDFKKEKNFLRFLAHHFPSKREIYLDNIERYIWISEDGREARCYKQERNCGSVYPDNIYEAGEFYKNADGLWMQYERSHVIGTGDYIPFYIVYDSTVTTAMLPYIKKGWEIPYGSSLQDDTEIKKTSTTFHDEDMKLKFTPAFKAGFWAKSGATPQYSLANPDSYAENYDVTLTNPASKEEFLSGSLSNFEIAVALDNSDPSNPKVIRNGIDMAKAKKMRQDVVKEEAIADQKEAKEAFQSLVSAYGLSQAKAFRQNGYNEFIGMSLRLYKECIFDYHKRNTGRGAFMERISEDSSGNAVYRDDRRWLYFYHGKLHHWVDR